ncbi:MAG TPA: hypothetical protein VMA30_03505 [Xanthobacteraceae bacterium]|nr:hypothetical protein [Xanthobacteraceae bacterium]
MQSKRSLLHLGFAVVVAFAVSSASGAPAYHGSARGGGTVTARDDAARTFTAARRHRAWTYQVTDKTRFVIGGAEGSWSDVTVGSVVQVRWHRAGTERVADVVGIRARSGH